MSEQEERQAVVAEALSCIGTPYHDHGRVKGVGLDCLTYLACVFQNAGLVPWIEIPHYSPQWHLHRNEERYIKGLLQYMREVEAPTGPGDIAVWKWGRCFAHGAIILDWPEVVQSVKRIGVHRANAEISSMLKFDNGKPRAVKFFSFWGK